MLVGKERFSEIHAWSDMPRHWPDSLDGQVMIEVVPQGQLDARLANGGPPVDVVVPLFSALPGRAIRAGNFGLIQQFGVGVDNVDLDAAAEEGVWVANMAGLNAVPVAEHAIALLLALARRLPEAANGFESGHWGEPEGRSLSGTAACVIGAGAVGTEIARRLAAFHVTVTGLRRHPSGSPTPPFAAIYSADCLLDCVAAVDTVIIAAGYQAGQPPLVDETVLRAMRPGSWLLNIARGALLDADAALAQLNAGHLAGIGLDVFRDRPISRRRTSPRPPTHRGDCPYRLHHERILRSSQSATRRRPLGISPTSTTGRTARDPHPRTDAERVQAYA